MGEKNDQRNYDIINEECTFQSGLSLHEVDWEPEE